MKHASTWCPSASLVTLAKSEALQRIAPVPSLRREPGTDSYVRGEGAPSMATDPQVVPLETPPS